MEDCRGRDREVKGSGSAHRRGDGLGSGPVGRADGYSGRGGSASGQTGPGGG